MKLKRNMFLISKFSSFKIIIFLTILAFIFHSYYFAINKSSWSNLLFSSFNKWETNLYLLSLVISSICYIVFTLYIYKKPEPETPVIGMPMETEGQFYYLIAYSILLLSSILFVPFVFNYACGNKNLDTSYIIKALTYLILIATMGIILLFNNTQFSLKTKKEKMLHLIVWVCLIYFFIQVSFLDIGFWTEKFIKK